MADLNGFNANDYEDTGFEPIPAGKYLAVISESEMKRSQDGSHEYLNLTFRVLEGEYANRLLWKALCIHHPKAQAKQIARGQLTSICKAVGILQPRDTAELHNPPMTVTVKVRKRSDTGERVNEISGSPARACPPRRAARMRRRGGGKR
ncbi:MAG: DUF669 domain-containing protein [Planctomycetota bacterium]